MTLSLRVLNDIILLYELYLLYIKKDVIKYYINLNYFYISGKIGLFIIQKKIMQKYIF